MAVKSVERALHILMLFTRQVPQLGVTEVSRILGVTKAAAHNLMTTMVDAGFLQKYPESRKYGLGFKVCQLGMTQPQAYNLSKCAHEPARSLSCSRRMVARVGLWDGEAMLVTATYYPQNRIELSGSIGPRIHAYASSLGRAVLAYLPPDELSYYMKETRMVPFTESTIIDEGQLMKELEATRTRGYALDREESVYGFACVGAALFDSRGKAIGALSLSGHPEKVLNEELQSELVRDLLRTTGEISRSLGYQPNSSII
ncbi:IclR helix-turn-helix domain protein [delta proteobacterium NaphS2]|nr:IclR helix-turn-helix domain protein [delta proteobacterium NaphS2]